MPYMAYRISYGERTMDKGRINTESPLRPIESCFFGTNERPSDLPAELACPPQGQCSGGKSLRQAGAVILRIHGKGWTAGQAVSHDDCLQYCNLLWYG